MWIQINDCRSLNRPYIDRFAIACEIYREMGEKFSWVTDGNPSTRVLQSFGVSIMELIAPTRMNVEHMERLLQTLKSSQPKIYNWLADRLQRFGLKMKVEQHMAHASQYLHERHSPYVDAVMEQLKLMMKNTIQKEIQ